MIIKIITLCIRKNTFKLISLNNTNLIHHLNCKRSPSKHLSINLNCKGKFYQILTQYI